MFVCSVMMHNVVMNMQVSCNQAINILSSVLFPIPTVIMTSPGFALPTTTASFNTFHVVLNNLSFASFNLHLSRSSASKLAGYSKMMKCWQGIIII